VHDNAQLAVVGVSVTRVQVRDLSDRQQGQKDEAYDGNHRQKAQPGAVFPAKICLKSCQSRDLDIPILQANPIIETPIERDGWLFVTVFEPTPVVPLRLNCVAMVAFNERRRWPLASLALLLLAGTATVCQSSQPAQSSAGQGGSGSSGQSNSSQGSKPLPLKPAVPGMGKNHRLILKDGSYQMVRDYQIVGDRVRYLSQERGEWEEMPVNLVDWDATKKWEKDHADLVAEDSSPAMKEAESIDKEESDERGEQSARMPKVAEGLELPDEDGVFVLDTYHGTPELVELTPTDLSMSAKSKKGIAVLNPLATQRASLEMDGAHAKVHVHVNDPGIYVSLGVEDQTEPVLTHPITVNTAGAKAVNGGKHGAHSAQSGFVIVRVDERQAMRIVGAVRVGPNGSVTQDEDTVATKVDVMPGKHWLHIVPQQTLTIGEYALVEIISPSDISESVWDFRVDPRLGDNTGSIGPIMKQGRDAVPGDNPGANAQPMSEHPDQ
jgi:hypothetical protein